MTALTLPALDPRVRWSIRIVDAAGAGVLAEHAPQQQCETASIGKVFLLIEVARRLAAQRDAQPDAFARDVLFAAWSGEELGLIGTTVVLACFCVIGWRGLRAAVRAPDRFGAFLAIIERAAR